MGLVIGEVGTRPTQNSSVCPHDPNSPTPNSSELSPQWWGEKQVDPKSVPSTPWLAVQSNKASVLCIDGKYMGRLALKGCLGIFSKIFWYQRTPGVTMRTIIYVLNTKQELCKHNLQIKKTKSIIFLLFLSFFLPSFLPFFFYVFYLSKQMNTFINMVPFFFNAWQGFTNTCKICYSNELIAGQTSEPWR